MTDPLITAAPVAFGGLLLVYFSRLGRPGLAIASSLLAIVGLWLLAQVLIPGYAPCPQGGCSLLAHLGALLDSRWFFMEYIAPLFLAALASRPFLIKGKLLPGIAGGLGVIGILWAIDIAPVFTCQGETVECEWAWVGFLFINAVAMLQGAALVLINLAMHISDQRRLARTAQQAGQRGYL